MPRKKITIFGAGISGLVAGINLAESGFEVEIREKRDRLGGPPLWHPSVHQQAFDLQKTSEYININIAECFKPVKRHTFYFCGRKKIINHPSNSYVCEKGPHSSSIENVLYGEAKKRGIEFVFGEGFESRSFDSFRTDRCPCIVATGLEEEPYRILGIKNRTIEGFRTSGRTEEDDRVISYLGEYTHHEFAYVASCEHLLFSLLFCRRGMAGKGLDAFRKNLLETEGLVLDDWKFSKGCIPVQKSLFKDGVVLAGTISGMIDPFYLNGISGSLISGKIAALFFMDQKRALEQFSWFTRNFRLKRFLKSIADRLPIKDYSTPAICMLNNRFRWVGVI